MRAKTPKNGNRTHENRGTVAVRLPLDSQLFDNERGYFYMFLFIFYNFLIKGNYSNCNSSK